MDILLVDDDSFLRDMYATKFSEAGHTVETVADATLAIACIKKKKFDVVLLDMVMPGMSGIGFLKEVVGLDEAKGSKFVVLSNQEGETDKQQAKKAGAIGYIIKAESIPSDVVRQVESIMNRE